MTSCRCRCGRNAALMCLGSFGLSKRNAQCAHKITLEDVKAIYQS